LSERIGKYVLEERIGAGGMAEVYRARVQGPQGFEKIVAVKRVLPGWGSSTARDLDTGRPNVNRPISTR